MNGTNVEDIMPSEIGSEPREQETKVPSRVVSADKNLRTLMREAQAGDGAAYARLLQAIQPMLQKIICRQWPAASVTDRDDLLQEILLRIHAARATYDPARPFIPWLKTIAMNQTIDFMRKQSRQSALWCQSEDIADVADESAHHAFHRYDTVTVVRKAVGALPNRQRSAIELLKLREMSLQEAVDVTGASASALKDSIHRALISLRVSLAPYQAA
jgi:RNA polymerase sigma factor (sigma-70 family)